MCQSLVDKVARSKQLSAVSHPEVLTLFENWLEELEEEVVRRLNGRECDVATLAEETGLSRSGAEFLLTKLRREGRL